MGEKAEEILASFGLFGQEKIDYNTVLTRFDNHFVPKKRIIHKTAKFLSRTQGSADEFIIDLYTLLRSN